MGRSEERRATTPARSCVRREAYSVGVQIHPVAAQFDSGAAHRTRLVPRVTVNLSWRDRTPSRYRHKWMRSGRGAGITAPGSGLIASEALASNPGLQRRREAVR